MSPPELGGGSVNRSARLLHHLLLALLAFLILSCSGLILSGVGLSGSMTDGLEAVGFYVGLTTCVLALLGLLRRGYVRATGLIVTWVLWIVLSIAAFLWGGVHSTSYATGTLIVLIGGLSVSPRFGIIMAGLSILSGAAMVYADTVGWMPPPLNQHTAQSRWVVSSFHFAFAAALVYLGVHGLNDALEHAQVKESELQEALHTLSKTTVSKKHLDSILQNMADYLVVTDPNGEIRRVNPALSQTLGVPPDDLVGVPLGDILFIPDDTRPGDQFRGWFHWENDRQIPVLATQSDLTDEQGVVSGIVTVASSMEQVERTQVARRAAEVAAEANEAKTRFLAKMSHELRTPLNAIIGYSEILLEDLQAGEVIEEDRDLRRILSSSEHLLSLIDDVLDLTRLDSQTWEMRPEEVILSDFLREVIGTVQPLSAARSNRIRLELKGDLGLTCVDPTRLRQILLNLLSNACKFTSEGEVILSAERTVHQEQMHLILSVSDTGIGIEPSRLESLFHPFAQVDDSHTRAYGGTGLGLTICKGLTERMGGEVQVESKVGEGTCFRIILPMMEPRDRSE